MNQITLKYKGADGNWISGVTVPRDLDALTTPSILKADVIAELVRTLQPAWEEFVTCLVFVDGDYHNTIDGKDTHFGH